MIYHNVWLTVKDPANIEKVGELLAEQARLSRLEPGCKRFEVYHSKSDTSRFLLIEQWETAEALEAHRNAHATTTIYKPHVIPLVDREAHPSNLIG